MILMAWAIVLLCVLLLALAFWAIVASDGESGMRPEARVKFDREKFKLVDSVDTTPTLNNRGKD